MRGIEFERKLDRILNAVSSHVAASDIVVLSAWKAPNNTAGARTHVFLQMPLCAPFVVKEMFRRRGGGCRLMCNVFLGAFEKIAKSHHQLRHVCLSIYQFARNNSALTERILLKSDI